MNNQINTYYIPHNPKIKSGPIYTLYINNNTNLELSSIINDEITIQKKVIKINEYNKLITISKEIQELLTKRTNLIDSFIKEENKTTKELSKLNIEYQSILKGIKDGTNV